MQPIKLVITSAGLNALTDAENSETETVRITHIGLTQTAFDVAPTLTALPGEFKRLDTFGGLAVSENVIHMTATDSSDDIYDLRGLGFYLESGTLFAVYGEASPIFRKVSIADFLLAFDVTFDSATAGNLTFGDALFLNPPATETTQGVVRFADDEEADAAESKALAINPFQLGRRLAALAASLGVDLDALEAWVQAQISAVTARTITATGAAIGGGSLAANRTIDVPVATAAQILAAASTNAVMTPAQWALLPKALGASGYYAFPGGLWLAWGALTVPATSGVTVTLPVNFPNTVRTALLVPQSNRNDGDEDDETWWVDPASYSASGFTIGVGATNNLNGGSMGWIAIGN